MNIAAKFEGKFKNPESFFTELFALLKSQGISEEEDLTLLYEIETLKSIYQHSDNAMDVLLRGLQSLGNIMYVARKSGSSLQEGLDDFGSLISAIGNLIEALNVLRTDAGYVLRQCGNVDY